MRNITNFHLSFTKFSLLAKKKENDLVRLYFFLFNTMKNRVKRSRSSNKKSMNSNCRRLDIKEARDRIIGE